MWPRKDFPLVSRKSLWLPCHWNCFGGLSWLWFCVWRWELNSICWAALNNCLLVQSVKFDILKQCLLFSVHILLHFYGRGMIYFILLERTNTWLLDLIAAVFNCQPIEFPALTIQNLEWKRNRAECSLKQLLAHSSLNKDVYVWWYFQKWQLECYQW